MLHFLVGKNCVFLICITALYTPCEMGVNDSKIILKMNLVGFMRGKHFLSWLVEEKSSFGNK